MQADREDGARGSAPGAAANDNPGSGGCPGPVPGAGAGGGAEARIEACVMTLAGLLGRRIAREEFRRLEAANDNAPADAGERRES